MHNTTEAPRQARRIEELLARLERSGDPAVVAATRELVEALMDLHGAALQQMLEIVARAGAAGQEIAESLGRDDLVGSLLVLYGLHPLDLETRVQRALEKLEPRLRTQRITIELLSVESGSVRVRVRTEMPGHGSSAGSLKTAVEESIYGAAPDMAHLVIEGLAEDGFVPLERLAGSVSAAVPAGMKGSL